MTSTQAQAGSAVGRAVREGVLKRQPCEVCGADKTVAHHDDYARPLDVRWLCHSHHRRWHAAHGPGLNYAGDRGLRLDVTERDYQRLVAIAALEQRSLANLIRLALGEYLDRAEQEAAA